MVVGCFLFLLKCFLLLSVTVVLLPVVVCVVFEWFWLECVVFASVLLVVRLWLLMSSERSHPMKGALLFNPSQGQWQPRLSCDPTSYIDIYPVSHKHTLKLMQTASASHVGSHIRRGHGTPWAVTPCHNTLVPKVENLQCAWYVMT